MDKWVDLGIGSSSTDIGTPVYMNLISNSATVGYHNLDHDDAIANKDKGNA